jgi:hypothetical protein
MSFVMQVNLQLVVLLMQHDADNRERVISLYQSRQLKAAEIRYPVHDKELLAMKYALVKFRVYLMGRKSIRDVHRPRVVALCDQIAASLTTYGTLAFVLCRIQLCCALQARQE